MSCSIKITAVCSFVLSQSMRVMEKWRDRQTELWSPRPH